jgi:hypothetical protein
MPRLGQPLCFCIMHGLLLIDCFFPTIIIDWSGVQSATMQHTPAPFPVVGQVPWVWPSCCITDLEFEGRSLLPHPARQDAEIPRPGQGH